MIQGPIFDAHFHLIDPRYPLPGNNGYVPDPFTIDDYRARASRLDIGGGAVVAGSFQGFAQDYLVAALDELGPSYVGVTQLPASTSDAEILRLHDAGIRAIRFNLFRGDPGPLEDIEQLANRVYELVGWHSEFYLDAAALPDLATLLKRLPRASIDHLAMRDDSTGTLLALIESGVVVKATGFGRMQVTDPDALMRSIVDANPSGLLFGSDLPSTRAAVPFRDEDLLRVLHAVGEQHADAVIRGNAYRLYGLRSDAGAAVR